MALDGLMMHLLTRELTRELDGGKVDRIQQPSREELVLTFRTNSGTKRLLISARAAGPRVGLIKENIENPAQPPMLCMLLRKQLSGGRLTAIRQFRLDRVMMLDFDCFGEMGDRIKLTLAIEIMGRCSNAVLVDGEGKIIDALKRVDGATSSVRMILPGLSYTLPPEQDKLSLLAEDPAAIVQRVRESGDIPLHKAILGAMQGVSPVISRELAYRACRSVDVRCGAVAEEQWDKLRIQLDILRDTLENGGCPTMISEPTGRPADVAVMRVEQYGASMVTREFGSVSEMLDAFAGGRDEAERMKVKSHDVLKVLATASDRVARRLTAQRAELEQAQKREELRHFGDLITANIYRLKKGDVLCELEDIFGDGSPVRVVLDARLTPAQNAQAYYKQYRRAQTAEAHLVPLIEQGERELEYIDSVFDMLSRAASNAEVAEIRAELTDEGYIRRQGKQPKRQPASLPPQVYRSDDGFEILAGRNNRQNERLSLRDAEKTDVWFHAAKIPGAHVIVRAKGETPPDSTLEQAAVIAATNSRGRESGTVAVDYTLAKHVSRQPGGKPGMVIYTDQRTVYVKPDEELTKRLRVK